MVSEIFRSQSFDKHGLIKERRDPQVPQTRGADALYNDALYNNDTSLLTGQIALAVQQQDTTCRSCMNAGRAEPSFYRAAKEKTAK
jgi:hypothetical protein